TITLILSLLMLLTATGIGHAIMEELSLEELTQGAGAIVVGTVEDAEVDSVGTSDGGTMIYTFVHLSIHEVLKGRLEDRHVVVRVAGGKIGDLEIRVEDQPKFEKGQRVLVFLRQVESPLSSRRLFEVYGLFQGVREPSDENISRVRTILDSSTPPRESDYFPIEEGMSWRLKATGDVGGETTDRIEAATEEGYRFASYNGHARTFAKSGSEVFEVRVREDGSIERRLWYDFSAATGDKWTIEPFDHTQGDLMDGTIVTVAGKNEEIRTAAGVEYAGCIHFRFDSAAGIADAGLLEEWFAPGKGCVKRVVQSIAGPIPYELVSLPIFIRSDALSLEVTTDKAHYEEGETIGITLTVRNNGEREVALDFPTSLQADYVIDGSFFKRYVSSDIHRVEVGATDGIYRWSGDMGFYQVTTWVTIPAGERHAWNFVHTPEDARLSSGPHRILGLLAGGGSSLQAETEITVGNLGKIEGAVVDKDVQPLSDVRIVAYRKWEAVGVNPLPTDPDEPNDELLPIPMLEPHFTATDENGQFAFEDLPVGESYLIGAFKEGYDLVWSEVPITSEVVPLDLVLPETVLVTVTGHVVDQNNA
ncbi:MAG: hypothetical protein KAR36_09795, partial [Candidatus Latescibacteria bacterium]|nr:hypothetical protein [Candidatus Latescibacterota bacterium]